MALKAGYVGIKKNILDSLMTLLGSKVIKTIGNGLTLSEVGALSTDIDTDTMEYKNGKLACIATGGVDYSESEVNTGLKWTDGRDIYMKSGSLTSGITMNDLNTILTGVVADVIIDYKGSEKWSWTDGTYIYPLNTYEMGGNAGQYNQSNFIRYKSADSLFEIFPRSQARTMLECHVTVYYVKPAAAPEEAVTDTRNTKKSNK